LSPLRLTLTRGATFPVLSPCSRVCEKITCANAPFQSRLGNALETRSILQSRARKQAFADIVSQLLTLTRGATFSGPLETKAACGRPRYGGMILFRALLPANPSPAVPATRARAAVLFFPLLGQPVSPQFPAPGPGLHIFTSDHAGLCLDVPPRHALGGHQRTVASDRRGSGPGDGWGWL
jgi:hypothetical protein